ncbi:MAG: nucleotide exchange factor GrpE [Bacteroidota bacterium]
MKKKTKDTANTETLEQDQAVNDDLAPETEAEETHEQEHEEAPGEQSVLEAKLAEKEDRYLRLYAEFENFKKRTQRERLQLMETAGRKTMLALLPILDDFDRARKAAETEDRLEKFETGIGIVIKKMRTTLAGQGLRAMESTGQPFNADEHEAVTEIPAPSKDMKGKVVDTVETGYMLNGTIIRHAKVVVGS